MNADAHPNYYSHELVYRRLRARDDRLGWNLPEEFDRELRLLEDMLSWQGVPASGSLLEIGCGAGDFALHLSALGWNVHGMDISPTAVAWAREKACSRAQSAIFEVGDVCLLEAFSDGQFELVLDGHCLHCIIGADRARCLNEVKRVLRPGGSFLVRTMCGPVAAEAASAIGLDLQTNIVSRSGVATRYIADPADLGRELSTAGFVEIKRHIVRSEGGVDLDQLLLHAKKPA